MQNTLNFNKNVVIATVVSLFLIMASLFAFVATASANELKSGVCGGAELSLSSKDCATTNCAERNAAGECTKSAEGGLNSLIANIVNIITVIVGIIAVIMIIFGGFKYITSGGDSGSISSAKNTIIYAIVGLIIVALAQVIVRFILNKV